MKEVHPNIQSGHGAFAGPCRTGTTPVPASTTISYAMYSLEIAPTALFPVVLVLNNVVAPRLQREHVPGTHCPWARAARPPRPSRQSFWNFLELFWHFFGKI